MEFSEWMDEFTKIINQKQTCKEKRTFEDYFATLADLPPVPGKSIKCAFGAELLRIQGNDSFNNGNYEDAAMMYTQSIRKAPPHSKCSAMAYGNRSAALYHLGAYEECVLDIDRALDLPYPDDLKAKLISRKEAAVSNMKNATSQRQKSNMAVDELKFPHGENAELPGASQGIKIANRKLVADMPFQTGDVLVVEKPFMTVPAVEDDPIYCFHCLKKSLCLIPCDKCTYNVYCSEKCRVEAFEKYHRIECSIQPTIVSAYPSNTQSMLAILRCLIILTDQGTNLYAVLDDIKEIENSSDPVKLGFTGKQFIGTTRKGFLGSLYGKELTPDPGSYFEETYVTILLRNYSDFFKINTDILAVAKLLHTLKSAYEINCIPIPFFGSLTNKAYATHTLLCLASHSCLNNTITYHDNDGKIVLRASEDIKPGDKISFNYLMYTNDLRTVTIGSSQLRGSVYHCLKCDKSVVFPPKRFPRIKVDKKLRVELRKCPNIVGLWKLLNLLRGNNEPNDCRVQLIKTMLVGAYEGRYDVANVQSNLRFLDVMR